MGVEMCYSVGLLQGQEKGRLKATLTTQQALKAQWDLQLILQ
jgi:hypothetical protein